jgi:ATP synthase protein I
VIEPGRGGAYLALFSEIGIVLLVATLLGVGVGYFVDTRLGSLPLFVLIGFLVGAGVGARGVYVLVTRFLATFDD